MRPRALQQHVAARGPDGVDPEDLGPRLVHEVRAQAEEERAPARSLGGHRDRPGARGQLTAQPGHGLGAAVARREPVHVLEALQARKRRLGGILEERGVEPDRRNDRGRHEGDEPHTHSSRDES